jgi:hypothetical protein
MDKDFSMFDNYDYLKGIEDNPSPVSIINI